MSPSVHHELRDQEENRPNPNERLNEPCDGGRDPDEGGEVGFLGHRDLARSGGSTWKGRSRLACARQKPSHDLLVRIAAAAPELVFLCGLFGEGRNLFVACPSKAPSIGE